MRSGLGGEHSVFKLSIIFQRCFTHLQDIFPLSKKDELFLKNVKIQVVQNEFCFVEPHYKIPVSLENVYA